MQRLKEAAEKAKKELSSAMTTNINLPFITATAEGPKHFDMNLTRAKFDELTRDLVDKTAIPVQNAMKDAGLNYSDLGQVLLVGGSTRIPAVQDKVRALTGKEPSKSLNPDECVAIGASIQGGKLAGDAGAGDILLLDVTPLSLSIETMGGVATRLIERNTTIPTKKSQIFSTAADGQTSVEVHVLQGEREMAKDNKTLGRFQLAGIAPAPRGVPQIEVSFDIDANGIVKVSAKDLGTGKEQKISIQGSSGLSKDEIERAKRDAEAHAEEDKKRAEEIDTINQADSLCFSVERQLKDMGDKLPADLKREIEDKVTRLKEAVSKKDVTAIKAGKEDLESRLEALYKAAEAAQQSAGAAGPMPGAPAEEEPSDGPRKAKGRVVDAEIVDDDK